MATYFDDVLNKDVEVQEEITPEVGKELKLDDPKEFEEIEGVTQ